MTLRRAPPSFLWNFPLERQRHPFSSSLVVKDPLLRHALSAFPASARSSVPSTVLIVISSCKRGQGPSLAAPLDWPESMCHKTQLDCPVGKFS